MPSRWPIVRNVLLIVLLLVGTLTVAAKKRSEPAPAPPPEPVPEVSVPTVAHLFPETGPPVAIQALPPGLASLSAQACNACHTQAHDDWQRSAHARAGRSPTYREAVARAGGTTACTTCHFPLANQHESLAAGYMDGDLTRPDLRPNPAWDATLMAEGVGCAACHVRDGFVVSTRATADAPHPVAQSTELGGSAFCGTCHQLTWPGADQPFYDTFGEWAASAYAKVGIRCQDCHMQPRAGLATASHFAASPAHDFGADPRRALTVLADLESSALQRGEPIPVRLQVMNTGAGHSVPTGSPFKAYLLEVELKTVTGESLAPPSITRLQRKVAEEPPWATLEDTRIAAGAQRVVELLLEVSQKKKAGPALLEIRLHKEGEAEAHVLQQIPVTVL